MKNIKGDFFIKKDLLFFFATFFLFFIAVVIPTQRQYYTYSSDARTTYENQGFQILDSLHLAQLPWWDPYNANGRDGTSLSVGMGAFAPDLLSGSFLVDKLFPNIPILDKSIIVNLIFRHFFVFGLGIWLLARTILKTRSASYFLWSISVFGTPLIMPLNNQMLMQVLIYFPWVLFFLLNFAKRASCWSAIGLFLSLATIFLAMNRDFPILLYAVFIAFLATVVVFYSSLIKIRLSFFSLNQWISLLLAGLALILLALSTRNLGQHFLATFSKVRATAKSGTDAPLTTEITSLQMIWGEFWPDLKSFIFPLPTVTPAYGHYHPAHSYLFMGILSFTLLFFSFSRSSLKFSKFFSFLILIFAFSIYIRDFPIYLWSKKIIPGLALYQYPFHLKYLILFCLTVLAAIGLDNLLEQPLFQKRRKVLISAGLITLFSLIIIVLQYPKIANKSLLIAGASLILITRYFESFLLLLMGKRKKVKKFAAAAIVCLETIIAIFFLSIGHGVHGFGWVPIRGDQMYFLKPRPNNFTLRAANLGNRLPGLCLGTVYKVNFAKDEHLRMNNQAWLYQLLPEPQKNILLGIGSHRLFLADKVKLSLEEELEKNLVNYPYSLRQVPVIVDYGNLPSQLADLQADEVLSRPQVINNQTVKIEIPDSLFNIQPLPDQSNRTRITIRNAGISQHLSSNPFTVEQEHIACYLNGEKLEANWFTENLADLANDSYELNKTGRDVLEVVTSTKPEEIEKIELEYLDPGGIKINDFGYNHLDLSYQAEGEKVLVYLDNYDENWQATIDEQPVPIMNAYGAYKAVLIPEGEHRVNFHYRPKQIIKDWKIAYFAYFFLVVLLLYSLFNKDFEKRK